jgi:hypothetical protein
MKAGLNDSRLSRGRVSQVNAKSETEQATSLVVGGTGLVGGYIVEHLLRGGARPLALSRAQQGRPGVDWFRGDLERPDTLTFPAFTTLYCTADAVLLADALPRLFGPSLRRVVAFSRPASSQSRIRKSPPSGRR